MKNFADTIKQLRSQMGLTATQLATRADLSPAFISKLESGEYANLTLATTKSLADGLGLTLKDVLEALGFLEEENQERSSAKLLAGALRAGKYAPEQIRKITEYAELLKRAEDNKS
jgi:transcriptional regulator with XRE-family HTH domain